MKQLRRLLALEEIRQIELLTGSLGRIDLEYLDRFIDKYPDLVENARLEAVDVDFED